MHEAVRSMMERYGCSTQDDYINALREILQDIALLGLWRGKFFENAAFYGGTALRVLYGLDRFSEDMDFSLLAPDAGFTLGSYGAALTREVESFGFSVAFQEKQKSTESAVNSAFLKANTHSQLMVIEPGEHFLEGIHPAKNLKIKIEVDTDPPQGFATETRYLLQPIPFSVRVFTLPDLFAGKLHAVLCRKWKNRVKGRDWYDLLWYAGRCPEVRITHLEKRMRQSGDYTETEPLKIEHLRDMLLDAVEELDIDSVRDGVSRFVHDSSSLDAWSEDLFREAIRRITSV